MPTRSSSSSVLEWPDRDEVDGAARRWAEREAGDRPEVSRIGYVGSYARGDWGPGSDLDLVVVLDSSDRPFEHRARDWDVTGLPVPADVLVYTEAELRRMREEKRRFAFTVEREAVWVWPEEGAR